MARVAFVLADGFEDSEFRLPWDAVREAGHHAVIVGRARGEVLTGKKGTEHVSVDAALGEVRPSDFDALVVPGGHSPERLRREPAAVAFAREFVDSGKTVAAVCHGPQLLADAEVLRGRTLTSWPSLQKDLEHAGAHWVDEALVTDGNLVTSRKPADLPAFCDALVNRLSHVHGEARP
jgi:protease I